VRVFDQKRGEREGDRRVWKERLKISGVETRQARDTGEREGERERERERVY
jgi:hypothetical protein